MEQQTPQHHQTTQQPPHQDLDTNTIVSNGKNTKINYAIVDKNICDMHMANSVLMFVDFKVLDQLKILHMDIGEMEGANWWFRMKYNKHQHDNKSNKESNKDYKRPSKLLRLVSRMTTQPQEEISQLMSMWEQLSLIAKHGHIGSSPNHKNQLPNSWQVI
jgi:hypothetical protein